MCKYQYPVYRHGVLYSTTESLDAATAQAVAAEVLSIWEADGEAALAREIEGAGYELVERMKPAAFSPPIVWEGWVARPPAYSCAVRSGDAVYGLEFRMSLVACLRPNKSKVWTRLLLMEIDDKPADGLSTAEVDCFYEWARDFCGALSRAASAVYASAVERCVGTEAQLEQAGEIEIRTVVSDEPALGEVAAAIGDARPISIAERYETQSGARLMSDFFHFAADRDIETYPEYRKFVAQNRERWGLAGSEGHQDEISEAGGLQVFGLSYAGCNALFSRGEELGRPHVVECFGVAPPRSGEFGPELTTYPPSITASVALMETISPFI